MLKFAQKSLELVRLDIRLPHQNEHAPNNYASFNLSGPNGRVPVKNMDCEVALELIQKKAYASPLPRN